MNQGQQKFYDFIMERVKDDRCQDAKALLEEHFIKQEAGTFTHEDIMQFIPKMTEMLKQEHVDEVTAIMMEFAGKHS